MTATAAAAETPWWIGAPTTLIKKTALVAEQLPDHLPVYTLTFAIPQNATFSGRAQPHAKVRIDMGDVVKMVIPGYKPKSYSMSALRCGGNEDEFDVTLKVYPNGRASGFLDRLAIGGTINTFGMQSGRIRNPGSYVGIVAYGVGITEGLPVAQAELEKGAAAVRLLWASRTMNDTFWHDDIEKLAKKYPNKFEIVHILSREEKEGCLHGRIDANVLQKVFQPDDPEEARFLTVGTKEMMSMTDQLLGCIDFPMPKHALLPKS